MDLSVSLGLVKNCTLFWHITSLSLFAPLIKLICQAFHVTDCDNCDNSREHFEDLIWAPHCEQTTNSEVMNFCRLKVYININWNKWTMTALTILKGHKQELEVHGTFMGHMFTRIVTIVTICKILFFLVLAWIKLFETFCLLSDNINWQFSTIRGTPKIKTG